jgi:thioredoxin-like negative regulator of GroEL
MPNLEDRLHDDGLTYDAYRAHWREQKTDSVTDKDPDARKMLHYLKYNWERQAHVHDEYTPSDDLQAAVDAIASPQTWMVITEPWCGDSAFLLPVIAEAAALNDAVSLHILLRDDHLDVMDQYLTDGSRSIPKLVALADDGTELFTWGPRPEGARQRFEELRGQYDDKEAMIGDFIEHYEDGGWHEADAELARAVHTSVSSPTE